MKKVLRIYRSEQRLSTAFEDAGLLGESWCENKIDIEINDSEVEISRENYIRTKQENSEQSIIQVLNSEISNTELLILPLHAKDTVADFISSVESNHSTVAEWQVVFNNFARYSFLESHWDLSANLPRDTKLWVESLVSKHGKNKILNSLQNLTAPIHLIGETIIDEYIYSVALGKVSKDPIIAFKIENRNSQLGGILAAAKHVEKISGKCTVITEVSEESVGFIDANLKNSISRNLVIGESTSQVTKSRYVDSATNTRVFETYSMSPDRETKEKFSQLLQDLIERGDIRSAIIIDFGHGLLESKDIQLLIDSGASISVNAQANAGNRGFNPISKYAGAKRIFINGSELELEARRKSGNRSDLVLEIAPQIGCREMYVTQGSAGLLYWTKEDGVHSAPGFAPSIVDRVGAGDALLATISTLRENSVEVDIASFYGNIAGALLVGGIGNSVTISRQLLENSARNILEKVI